MFFETHHRMGQLLHDRLERLHPGRINRDAFVYGNVKPDLMRKGAKDRHMLCDTAPFLNLTARFLYLPSHEPEEDWVLLGMICHHVCDSFCRYHQEVGLYRDYPRHLDYELGLNAFFMGWVYNGLAVDPEGRVVDTGHPEGFLLPEPSVPRENNEGPALLPGAGEQPDEDNLTALLGGPLAGYRSGEPSFFLDSAFALQSSARVVDHILGVRFGKSGGAI